MKLLVITAVKSFEKEAVKLFKKAGITAFSNTDINGFKSDDQENLIDNWFSSSSSKVNSILFFTFSEAHKINTLLNELEAFNQKIESDNPIRAIVLNVEKYQ
jgi:hypothetical protein